jgi:hypothetical protein
MTQSLAPGRTPRHRKSNDALLCPATHDLLSQDLKKEEIQTEKSK